MWLYLAIAMTSACLGFLACSLLAGARLRETHDAHVSLALGVRRFLFRCRRRGTARVSDLFVPQEYFDELEQVLHASGYSLQPVIHEPSAGVPAVRR